MEKKEKTKGRLKYLTAQAVVVLIMAVLVHFIFNGQKLMELPEFKFPRSLALALLLRLSSLRLKYS